MRRILSISLFLGLCLGLLGPQDAWAEQTRRYASIVVNTETLEIVHARQIDEARFPASLTKVMTLYLTFDALNAGTLKLNQKLTVSRNAANTPPVKLGLRTGQSLTVSQAIQALTVRSANDAAVVLAETLGGTEENFAKMMTERASALGMIKTQFHNPHGLPHPDQTTTARDMAKLATAILNHHRRYYHYFGQKTFRYKGRVFKNTNSLLHDLPEVDGFKTGYTDASGYNLIISAQKNEQRLVAVVLGGASGTSRNQHMQDLIRRGFKSIRQTPTARAAPISVASAGNAPVATLPFQTVKTSSLPSLAHPGLKTDSKGESAALRPKQQAGTATHAVRLRGRNKKPVTIISQGKAVKLPTVHSETNWSVQIGTYTSQQQAMDQLTAFIGHDGHRLTPENGLIMPTRRGGTLLFQSRFGRLGFSEAQAACAAILAKNQSCFVMAAAQ